MSMMKSIVLICFLIAFAAAARGQSSSSGIQLDVFSGSSQWWLAVAIRNAGVDTQSVQVQQAQSSTWQSLIFQNGWGYYTLSSNDKIKFPVSVRLTSTSGAQVTINNGISSTSVGIVNTGVTYSGSSSSNPTTAPKAATTAPKVATAAPNKAATTAPKAATTAPKAATTAPKAATTAPKAATTAPKAATTAPKAATTSPKVATSAPSLTGTGCSAPLKLMVPLYTYPGASWDSVAAGGRTVPTVAIINPNSGPGTGPDSTYNTYMAKLNAAGVDLIGYVHTSYGTRSIATVKAEIDIYAAQFPLVKGIFLDEAGNTASVLPYYQELYRYIMSMPGWKYDVINPGAVPSSGYTNAATQIVSFEDTSSKFAASANPSSVSCTNKDQYAVITYGASTSGMQNAVATARNKGYYGWVYVTDATDVCCIYNVLSPYYAAMVSYIASTN